MWGLDGFLEYTKSVVNDDSLVALWNAACVVEAPNTSHRDVLLGSHSYVGVYGNYKCFLCKICASSLGVRLTVCS